MWIEQIFQGGWWKMAIGYAVLFYLFQYITYKIIFRVVVGQPEFLTWEAMHDWRRRVNFIGAVVFAPLFEEFIITFLAYTSFLQYARNGQEGVIILMVAAFFALLHLPGDWLRQRNSYSGIRPFTLLLWQCDRFFYSLCAYFLYKMTGFIWYPILLHYLANAFASIYNFDLEDELKVNSSIDIILLLIILIQVGIVVFGTYQFQLFFPVIGFYLMLLAVGFLMVFLFRMYRVARV